MRKIFNACKKKKRDISLRKGSTKLVNKGPNILGITCHAISDDCKVKSVKTINKWAGCVLIKLYTYEDFQVAQW